jgi:AcrR family transcriptional regulator
VTRSDGGLRARHKRTTRRALVDTALRLFDEHGYGEVTVDDVCAEVEVSPRTFFRYFPAKEHVLAEPITLVLAEIRDNLVAHGEDGSVWQALRAALLSAVDVLEERRAEVLRAGRVIRETPGALASSARALMEWEQAMRDEVAQRLDVPAASMHARLLLGTAMLAFRAALDEWTDEDGAEPVGDLLTRALDAVEPGAGPLERGAKPTAAAH